MRPFPPPPVAFSFNGTIYTPSGQQPFSGAILRNETVISGTFAFENERYDARTDIAGILLNEDQYCIPHSGRAARDYLVFDHFGTGLINNHFHLFKEASQDFEGHFTGKFERGSGPMIGVREPIIKVDDIRIINYILGLEGSLDVELDLKLE